MPICARPLSRAAGAFGNRLGPDAVWRFAEGQVVMSSTVQKVRLARPPDWMALTDHTDLMGFASDLRAGKPGALPLPQTIRDAVLRDWRRQMARELVGARYESLADGCEVSLPSLIARE